MTHTLCDAFAAVLRDRRTDFNERFERARHLYPQLAGDDVIWFLRECVDGAIAEVARADLAAIVPLVLSAYDTALTLCGQKLVGPSGEFPIIEEGWRRVLPAAAALLAREPTRVIPAVSNALHKLATSPGTRPSEWISSLSRLAPQCVDIDTFLRVGQVLAWHAGLAHLRASALAAAQLLPADIAAAAVGARSGNDWPATSVRLSRDTWFEPSLATLSPPGPRVVKEVGAFRGFGGLFVLPPQIAAAGDGWLVQSAGQHWYLAADAFGATFHRATAEEWNTTSHEPQLPADVRLTGPALTLGSSTLQLPVVGPMTSVAVSGSTIAITSAHTHSVAFIALD
jgi:hypothetical protein